MTTSQDDPVLAAIQAAAEAARHASVRPTEVHSRLAQMEAVELDNIVKRREARREAYAESIVSNRPLSRAPTTRVDDLPPDSHTPPNLWLGKRQITCVFYLLGFSF